MHHWVHRLDLIGAILSFLATVLTMRASLWLWPLSLVAISVNIVLYTTTQLYADAGKELIYALSCVYGWVWWLRGGSHRGPLSIQGLSWRHGLTLSGVAVACTAIITYCLLTFTRSATPLWDATTTVLSLTGQWLTCRKVLACWFVWCVVDALYAGLYFHKGMTAHGVLLCVYTGMAGVGYRMWLAQSRGTKKSL